jgi:leucyl aminopeptidase
MQTKISLTDHLVARENTVFLVNDLDNLPSGFFSKEEIRYIAQQKKIRKKELTLFNRLDHTLFVQSLKEEKNSFKKLENWRMAGDKLALRLNDLKIDRVVIHQIDCRDEEALGFVEGVVLGNYQFLKYISDREKANTLGEVRLFSMRIKKEQVEELSILAEAVTVCRTLINEPFSYLDAAVFAREVEKMGKECGAKVEVMNKKKIEALKMGGLLAVNQASQEPPTFTVMEWKPAGAVNKKPFVFVGKGVVYDSGGMNLKPGDSMATMKDDMSGAAAVACAIFAIAKAKLPVHVIGLMPATDNKIGPKAIMPGDIISMHNGKTVEVFNTDAEGRLILADALSYASKYKPGLVIDLATLTGAAVRAIGKFGMVAMQVKAEKELEQLSLSGWNVYERLVEFPAWEEYGELLKSDIADLKNLGPGEAGAITAGKFLENFTDYPFIHLDIAGPAYLDKRDSYRGQGGTGVGVRLLFDFMKRKIH